MLSEKQFYWLFRCLPLCCLQVILSTTQGIETMEVNEVYVRLTNGSIFTEGRSKSPGCDDGGRIRLMSYVYQNKECTSGHSCNVTFEKNLSSVQEYLLHKLCSFREECLSLHSLLSTEIQNSTETQNSGVNTVKLVYQCLDNGTQYIEICNDETKTIYQTNHLLFHRNRSSFTRCKCILDGDEFRMAFNDIRLTSSDTDICSKSKLQIDTKIYHCDSTKANFGSDFRMNKEKMKIAFISLTKDPASGNPSMVWLTIQSEGNVTITCTTSKKSDLHTHATKSLTSSGFTWLVKHHTGPVSNGHATTSQAIEPTEAFQEHEAHGIEDTFTVSILSITGASSFAVLLLSCTCAFKRKKVLYCLRNGTPRLNVSSSEEIPENIDRIDTAFTNNEEGNYNINNPNAQVFVKILHNEFNLKSGASSDYQEIRDIISTYVESESIYEKIDPDLKQYDSEYSKMPETLKPKVPPKPDTRMLSSVSVTNDERIISLTADQRKLCDIDYIHPVESAGAIEIHSNADGYLCPSIMDETRI